MAEAQFLTFSYKFQLIIWKNIVTYIHCFRIVGLTLCTPAFFSTIIVILRLIINVETLPKTVNGSKDLEENWKYLTGKIATRHQIIKNKTGQEMYNTYMPRMVIAYAPKQSEAFNTIIQHAVKTYLPDVGLLPFDDCSVLRSSMQNEFYYAGVCYHGHSSVGEKWPHRMNFTLVYPNELRLYDQTHITHHWKTDNLYHVRTFDEYHATLRGEVDEAIYISEGFILLQKAISLSYIHFKTGIDDQKLPEITISSFPVMKHVFDKLSNNLDISLSFLVVVSHLCPILYFMKYVLLEKFRKTELLMDCLFLNRTLQYTAWLVPCALLMSVASLFMIILLKIHWNSGYAVLNFTPITTLLAFLFLYNICSLSFCYFISNLYLGAKASLGASILALFWFLSYLPFLVMVKFGQFNLRLLSYIFPNSVMGLIFQKIAEFENCGNGIAWDYLHAKDEHTYKLRIETYFLILVGLSIVFSILALALSRINLYSWHIPDTITNFHRHNPGPRFSSIARRILSRSEIFEIVPDYKKCIIEFRNITLKINNVKVLDNLSFAVYQEEFIVLMGHNGAGKSVLFEIAIGLREPTAGQVIINMPHAESSEMKYHNTIGVCFPETLFNDLSVENQLMLFARLRGLCEKECVEEVEKYLAAMGMTTRRHTLTRNLTLGLRQYLATCIALIGGTTVVLLEEPSSKLDISTRTSLWKLLHTERKGRTILMSTQSGTEAEILADRVIMISSGVLKCSGSPYYLKQMCGLSYRVIFFKRADCISDNVTEELRKYIPHITPMSDFGAELSYTIYEQYFDRMAPFFLELKNNYDKFGLETCTIREISIEDVFYSLGAENPSDGERSRLRQILNGKCMYRREQDRFLFLDVKHSYRYKWLYQFLAVVYKNHLYIMSRKWPLFLSMVTGILTIMVSFLTPVADFHHPSPLCFKLDHYRDAMNFVGTKAQEGSIIKRIEDQYRQIIFEEGIEHDVVNIGDLTVNEFMESIQKNDIYLLSRLYISGITFAKHEIKIWFNNFLLHTSPLSLNMGLNAFLQSVSETARIAVCFEPLPYQTSDAVLLTQECQNTATAVSLNLAIAICYMGSLGIMLQVKEKFMNFTFLQMITGMHPTAYWAATLLIDIVKIIFTSIIFLSFFLLHDNKIFHMPHVMGLYLLVFLLTGLAFVSVNYTIGSAFRQQIDAYIAATTFHAFGCLSTFLYLNIFSDDVVNHIMDMDNRVEWFFRIFPLFSFCSALINIFTVEVRHTICQQETIRLVSKELEKCQAFPNCCVEHVLMRWEGGILFDLTSLVFVTVVCVMLIFFLQHYYIFTSMPKDHKASALLHYKRVHGFPPFLPLDDDCLREEMATDRLTARDVRGKPLVCRHIGKLYDHNSVLNHVTFHLEDGDLLAVLGPNGSGKSTLLEIIAGAMRMSYGSAFVKGNDVYKNPFKASKYIGFCSSVNSLPKEFTVYQSMKLFCLLIGISYNEILDVCENLAKLLGIYTNFYTKLRYCSMGVLMRVNCAIAILKRPKLLCLDCPTNFVDVVGQRLLWNVLNNMRDNGTTIVYSSRSMSECERHSNKLLIMYDGFINSIGPTFKLSSKYELVYSVHCKLKRLTAANRRHSLKIFLALSTFMETTYPRSRLSDSYCNMVIFTIPIADTSLGEIFETMRFSLIELNLETFFVTRETLSGIYMDSAEKEKLILADFEWYI